MAELVQVRCSKCKRLFRVQNSQGLYVCPECGGKQPQPAKAQPQTAKPGEGRIIEYSDSHWLIETPAPQPKTKRSASSKKSQPQTAKTQTANTQPRVYEKQCVQCKKTFRTTDPNAKFCKASCSVTYNIQNGKVNNNVDKDYYTDKKTGKFKKKYRISGMKLFLLNLLLVAGVYIALCITTLRFVPVADFFSLSWVSGFFTVISETVDKINYEFLEVIVVYSLIALLAFSYLLIPVTIYNIFDFLASPIWLLKKDPDKKRKRKEKRGRFLKGVIKFPFIIPLGILKYMWEMVKIFIGATPEGLAQQARIDQMKREGKIPNNEYKNNYSVPFRDNSKSENMARFTEEYRDQLTLNHSYGSDVTVNNTYGLTQDEMRQCMAEAASTLESAGFKYKDPGYIRSDTLGGRDLDDVNMSKRNSR